jgi:hypothetical protein
MALKTISGPHHPSQIAQKGKSVNGSHVMTLSTVPQPSIGSRRQARRNWLAAGSRVVR